VGFTSPKKAYEACVKVLLISEQSLKCHSLEISSLTINNSKNPKDTSDHVL
jgi:hypothetical protein